MMRDDGCGCSSDQIPAPPNLGTDVQVIYSSVLMPSIHIWIILPDQRVSYLVHTITGSAHGWFDCHVDILFTAISFSDVALL